MNTKTVIKEIPLETARKMRAVSSQHKININEETEEYIIERKNV